MQSLLSQAGDRCRMWFNDTGMDYELSVGWEGNLQLKFMKKFMVS
jgi:hypothetical protein